MRVRERPEKGHHAPVRTCDSWSSDLFARSDSFTEESEFNLEYSRLEWALGLGRGDKLGLDTGLLRSTPGLTDVSCALSGTALPPKFVAEPWLPRLEELMLLITSWLDINRFSTDLFLLTRGDRDDAALREEMYSRGVIAHRRVMRINCCSETVGEELRTCLTPSASAPSRSRSA